MIRYRGELAIITDKNPVLLDGYEPVNNDLRVQRRIMKSCDFRVITYTPSTCCGRMAKKMKATLSCLVFNKEVTANDCKECHELQ